MKYLKLLFFLSFSSIAQTNFSQDKIELNKLLSDGEKAFLSSNFVLAKEIYTKATTLFPKEKNRWYNLGATLLALGENEDACENFYMAYRLGDNKILEDIKEFCPSFRNGTIMSIKDVDVKPKFNVDGNEYYLFGSDGNLNPIFLKTMIREIKKSKRLKEKVKGKIIVSFSINRFDEFDGQIVRTGADEKDVEIVKTEIMAILKTMVTYISAEKNSVKVDILEKWMLPIAYN